MSIVKRLSGFVVALGVLALGLGMILPTSWKTTRSTRMNADPAQIHRLVGDLETWPGWTGWSSGSGSGVAFDTTFAGTLVGSSLSWTGSWQLGGKLTLIRSDRDDGVIFDLALNGTTVNGRGSIVYAFDRENNATTVTWSEAGMFVGRPLAGFLALVQSLTLGTRIDGSLRQLKEAAERGR